MKLTNITDFFKSIFAEIKLIDWASKSEVYTFTMIVFVMLLIFAMFFILVDFSAMKFISYILF